MNRRRDRDWLNDRGAIAPRARWLVLCAAMLLGACALPRDPAGEAADPPLAVAGDDQTVTGLLGYAQQIAHMSNAELAKERTQLAGVTETPSLRMRQALLLAQLRESSRAQVLLEGIAKSSEPSAVPLQALARLLSTQLAERQRLEQALVRQTTQTEQVAQQLRDSQRRVTELQEKIDALADIERSLKARPGRNDARTGGGQ